MQTNYITRHTQFSQIYVNAKSETELLGFFNFNLYTHLTISLVTL